MVKVYDEHQDICPDCIGEGCNECDGTGYIIKEPPEPVPCGNCEGGKIFTKSYGDDHDYDDCPACNGSGFIEE